MTGYGSREVSRMLGLSVGQLRSYVRAGFLHPARGARGELRFTFQDLVLLRAAQGLLGARIAARRVRAALRKLRSQLPEGRTLRDVHIRAEGDRIVVADGARKWSAEDGQILFDFGTAELARRIAPLARKPSVALDADGMYERGCDLEAADPGADRSIRRTCPNRRCFPTTHRDSTRSRSITASTASRPRSCSAGGRRRCRSISASPSRRGSGSRTTRGCASRSWPPRSPTPPGRSDPALRRSSTSCRRI